MKFRIITEQFIKFIQPALDIALKNIKKEESRKYFYYAKSITLKATADTLQIIAYGGTASIIVTVNKDDGYIPDVTGVTTIRALELQSALNAFALSDNLFVTAEDYHMMIAIDSDRQIFISLPTSPDHIRLPNIPKKFGQEATVDREYFANGLDKIKYAPAIENKMYTYMCVLFETSKNNIRFSAGSGGRFAAIEYESNSKKISSTDMKIIFPKTNIPNIIRIFKKVTYPTITIKPVDVVSKKLIPEQIILEAGNIVLCIYDVEKFTKYPDLFKVINLDYSYKISTRLKDWKYVGEAITASRHYYKEKIHNVKVTANLLHGYFDIHAKTEMQMNRRIDFDLGTYAIDTSKGRDHKPWFCCNADWLIEMVKDSDKDKTVIFNFECQSKLDNIPDDKPKQMEPILLKFPEKTDKDGVKEKNFVFFTVSSK